MPVSSEPSRDPSSSATDQWRKFLGVWAGPGELPEESRALRLLVQGLVTVGIASVSVAAIGVAPASWLNLLAIPLSAIGGYWSWRRRHQANITVKFVIALGMLLALGFFLSRLLGEGSDTRVRLAELLIHLQVLHSFDMPRRKDLGYSMVIGLILLGVAATISQTLTLAPFLLTFLAIALPVLILDYRSRLGLRGWQAALGGIPTVRRMGLLLGITVLLGLTIFLLLPRLPGYQIRNFPVSATISFEGDFSGDRITNPGAGFGTDGEGGEGDSEGNGTGPGQLDDTFYYGFSRRINQNLRGSLIPQVLLRVRSQAVGFWRVMAFDRYTGQGWEVSREDEVEVIRRSGVTYQTFLPESAFRPGLTDMDQGRQREVIQTYTVVNPLPNVMPALYQARQIYFPTQEVAIDTEGGLRSPIPLSPGLTYTVLSQVPYRDRTLLRDAPTDYTSSIQDHYLQVPEGLGDRLSQTAQDLMAQAPQPLTDPYETALYLAQALKQNYTLLPELPFFETEEDLVTAFLYRYEGGYTDHFSTVLTVMLRSLGIPARLVVGFGPGEFNPFTGYSVVRNTDAYAMTEVLFPGYGWFAFDPIPTHDIVPPSIQDYQTFSVLRQFWNWVAGWLPSPVAGLFNNVFLALTTWASRIFAFLSQGWLQVFVGLIGVTGLGFGLWLSWLGWRSWRRQRWLKQLPAVERIYQQLLAWLAIQGFPKAPTQTPLEHVQQIRRHNTVTYGPQVSDLVEAYVRWRYGGQPQDEKALHAQARSLMGQQHPAPNSRIIGFR
ncbi:DUF3488 and DUF4129 domain-containing transglutaminase family protein [Leptolyngbya sp. PCC 6406]|uniref:transglutaminase TgpA family protein n=1 Tax=Leptolyngbya sp. PCC 6406 TaxID=1173264 RepID=UPI0002AC3731|nr:DUF3488 and DUF4129 domain-containing transglutaminase family protein [Leptolyngbya sp. PCC 6406]